MSTVPVPPATTNVRLSESLTSQQAELDNKYNPRKTTLRIIAADTLCCFLNIVYSIYILWGFFAFLLLLASLAIFAYQSYLGYMTYINQTYKRRYTEMIHYYTYVRFGVPVVSILLLITVCVKEYSGAKIVLAAFLALLSCTLVGIQTSKFVRQARHYEGFDGFVPLQQNVPIVPIIPATVV